MLVFTLDDGYPECGVCGKDLFQRMYTLVDGDPICLTCYMKPEPEPVFCGKCIHREFVDDGMWEGDKCASKPDIFATYLHVYFQRKDCQLKNSCNDCQEFELQVPTRMRRLGRWVSKLLRR